MIYAHSDKSLTLQIALEASRTVHPGEILRRCRADGRGGKTHVLDFPFGSIARWLWTGSHMHCEMELKIVDAGLEFNMIEHQSIKLCHYSAQTNIFYQYEESFWHRDKMLSLSSITRHRNRGNEKQIVDKANTVYHIITFTSLKSLRF